MEAKFEVGDTVRVLEPADKSEYPSFTPGMAESIGHCYVIEEVSFINNIYTYSFNIEGRRWYRILVRISKFKRIK